MLGSTGSIGRQTLQVVDNFYEDYSVEGLAAGSNIELFVKQILKYRPRYVSVASEENILKIKDLIPSDIQVFSQKEGLVNLASLNGIDLIVVAVNGIHGLLPTLTALEKGTPVALANKETLVTAGSLVMKKAREKGIRILPVDSEHSAVFQCLEAHNEDAVDKLIITASGGPFLEYDYEQLKNVTLDKALRHPKWQMGKKITIDSASLINKGLEVIEAHWLFQIPYEKIEVVIHPQSIIHSMVQYSDGSVLAQLGMPDMRVPIQYALTYPLRKKNTFPKLKFYELDELTFKKPDIKRFPGLTLAYEAGKISGTMPTVFNAANEIAVELFLQEKIKFLDIPKLIESTMQAHQPLQLYKLEDILHIDSWARRIAGEKACNL